MTEPTATQPPFTVFFAWQSDLPPEANKNRFRNALRAVTKSLNSRTLNTRKLRVEYDEATRGATGSPNIPLTIQTKIRKSDAFVADITSIVRLKHKGLPNPNVGFELGFAAALLGWDRIILLYNKEFGRFPTDVPFDFDRHRILDVTFPARGRSNPVSYNALTKPADTALRQALERAIWEIVTRDPPRPARDITLSVQELKRDRDVTTLRLLASRIHAPSLQRHINKLPGRIWDSADVHLALFEEAYVNPLHHLYDERAKKLIDAFHRAWVDTFSEASYFNSVPNRTFAAFTMPGDFIPTAAADRAWKFLESARERLAQTTSALFDYLRETYPEIDLASASDEAWRMYKTL